MNLNASRINGGNSKHGRQESDYYPTPPDATIALLHHLSLPRGTVVWEPACGKGHMSKVIEECGYPTVSTDLRETGYGEGGIDFLECDPRPCDWIITNPPFRLATGFIERCNEIRKPFALLIKSQFWNAGRRFQLFQDMRPSEILPLSWRPDFTGKGAAMMDMAWCVWNGQGDTRFSPLKRPAKMEAVEG